MQVEEEPYRWNRVACRGRKDRVGLDCTTLQFLSVPVSQTADHLDVYSLVNWEPVQVLEYRGDVF